MRQIPCLSKRSHVDGIIFHLAFGDVAHATIVIPSYKSKTPTDDVSQRSATLRAAGFNLLTFLATHVCYERNNTIRGLVEHSSCARGPADQTSAKMSDKWSTGLCGCCSDCETCCTACVVPSFMLGQHNKIINQGGE